MATKAEALVKLYNTLNHPRKAGTKWVTYSRETIQACVDIVRELAIYEGAEVVSVPSEDALKEG